MKSEKNINLARISQFILDSHDKMQSCTQKDENKSVFLK